MSDFEKKKLEIKVGFSEDFKEVQLDEDNLLKLTAIVADKVLGDEDWKSVFKIMDREEDTHKLGIFSVELVKCIFKELKRACIMRKAVEVILNDDK